MDVFALVGAGTLAATLASHHKLVGCYVSTHLPPRSFSPHLHIMIHMSLGASSPASAVCVLPCHCLLQAQLDSSHLLLSGSHLAAFSPLSLFKPDRTSLTHLHVCCVLKLGRNFGCGVVALGLPFFMYSDQFLTRGIP